MQLTIEQPCPQCGGPVELTESDHILICPYCGTKSCLATTSRPSLLLPPAQDFDEMIYVPYLRFRGSIYSCIEKSIEYKIIDTSILGTPLNILPTSLGIRPQAMKTVFATDKLDGTFLKCLRNVDDAVEQAAAIHQSRLGEKIYYKACIGETISLIYQPLFLKKNKLGDAITGKLLAHLKEGLAGLSRVIDSSPPLKLNFLPTICPECGWNLQCAGDSIVLTCSNCRTAWQAAGKHFSRIHCQGLDDHGRGDYFLPFWKMDIKCNGINFNSFADFVRLANLPKTIQPDWETRQPVLWCPAFKVRPKIFLRMAARCSSITEELASVKIIPARSHPVNLPLREARESLKLILASAAINTKKLIPNLKNIELTVTRATLFYLPFDDTGYDLRQPLTGIYINKQILNRGKYL